MDISEAFQFDEDTLLVCYEIDNVRMENVCRAMKLLDHDLWRKIDNSFLDQDWPDSD